MSILLECDSCKKQIYVDSNTIDDYVELAVKYDGKIKSYHICQDCFKTKFLNGLINED